MIGNALRGVLLLAVAPGVAGLIKQIKARLQGRRGPAVIQPYRDLYKLLGKEPVVSRHSSWLTRSVPYIVMASALLAGVLVPPACRGLLAGHDGDLILVVGLYALGRFAAALAGLDAGSAFGGMGSSREMLVAALAEPVMMLTMFTLAVPAGSTGLGAIAEFAARSGIDGFSLPRLLSLAAFAFVVLAETGRVPVDNPDTHLELTMIHEGMVLEMSGRYLALIQWASMVKQLTLFVMVGTLFLPGPADGLGAAGLRIAEVGVMVVAVAFTESVLAKMRFFQLPRLLGAAFLFSTFAMAAQTLLGG